VQGLRFGDVLEVRVVDDCPVVKAQVETDVVGHRQDRLLLTAEDGAGVRRRIEQRLDAERIAGEEHRPVSRVPHREREHSTQVVDDVRAPVVETDHDGLRVTGCGELVTFFLELLPEFDVVVDLAVERHRVSVRLIGRTPLERLMRVLEVDDRQAVEPEDHVVVVPGAVFVRAAVPHAGECPGGRVHETGGVTVGRQNSKKSTHVLWGHLRKCRREPAHPAPGVGGQDGEVPAACACVSTQDYSSRSR
jgi:hypothetical protein